MAFYPTYQEQWEKLSPLYREALEEIPYIEDIEGWLLLIESAELYLLSKQINSSNPIICEIGVWKGKSSYIFAKGLKPNGILYSIDPFDGDGDIASKDSYKNGIENLNISLLQNFENTMKKYFLWERIRVLPFLSAQARSKFFETKIDLLFIDGNHDYDAVKEDYFLWSGLIPPGGVIVLHDVGAIHVDGPRRVAEEFIFGNSKWKNARIVGEMIVATKS